MTYKATEVPIWLRIPFIDSGYMLGNYTWLQAMTTWHNETVNAWTMVFSLALGTVMFAKYSTWPCVLLWLAQVLHHPVSIAYHTLKGRSQQAWIYWRNLDLTLILIMNVLLTLAFSWRIWGCTGALITTSIIVWIAFIGIQEIHKGAPDCKRILKLIGMCAMGYYIPVVYRAIAGCMAGETWSSPAVIGAIGMLLCHTVAGLLYATKWPERAFPGTLCTLGTSHNALHVLLFVIFNYGYYYLSVI